MAQLPPKIPLSKEEKQTAAQHLKTYLAENYELEIGGLQAEIFLDFITDKIGPYYYNRAIVEAMGFITEKAEDMYMFMKDAD